MIVVTTWVALEDIGLSGIAPTETDKQHMITLRKETARRMELTGARYKMVCQRLRGEKMESCWSMGVTHLVFPQRPGPPLSFF